MASRSAKTKRRTLLLIALSIIPIYAVWARSGTFVPWQAPFIYLSGGLVFAYLLLGEGTPLKALHNLVRDPLWLPVLVLLSLLVLQWENAGRVRILDLETEVWRYSPPRRVGWPSAFTRVEAFEMLSWFVPASALLLIVRRLAAGWGLRVALVIVFFASANAALGIVQEFLQLKSMYGIIHMHTHFFASFGYENHAAAFFSLCLAWSLGLFLNCLGQHPSERPAGLLPGLLLASVLLFVAANLSMSLAGILFSWSLVLFAAVYGIWIFRHRMHPVVWIRGILGVGLCLTVATIMLVERGSDKMVAELKAIGEHGVDRELSGRRDQAAAAISMFKEAPLFGLGGWGYRYHVTDYMHPRKWHWGLAGAANAHNDPAQFLAELGLVGFIALASGLGLLGVELVRAARRAARQGNAWFKDPIWVFGLAGLSVTLGHSLMDLPFRCPAILFTWTLLAGVLTLETKNMLHNRFMT